jgi:hypothetical protein
MTKRSCIAIIRREWSMTPGKPTELLAKAQLALWDAQATGSSDVNFEITDEELESLIEDEGEGPEAA